MEPVTAIIGLLLTALGVWFGYVQVRLQRKARKEAEQSSAVPSVAEAPRGLIVTLAFGLLTYENPRRVGDTQMLLITVANPLPRPVRIIGVGLELEKIPGTTLVWFQPGTERPMPFELRETEHNLFWWPLRDNGEALWKQGVRRDLKVRPYVNDSYGRRHTGDWADCSPVTWRNG